MSYIRKFLSALLPIAAIAHCALASERSAAAFSYSGAAGGMMLHAGYVAGQSFTYTAADGASRTMSQSGFTFGIGGRMHFCFGRHLRAGGEGYTSTLSFADNSYVQQTWGGVTLDCVWPTPRLQPFAGFTFGGGAQKALTLPDNFSNDFRTDDALFRRYGFLLVAPFVGLEVVLTRKVHAVCKADYLVNLSNPQRDFVRGVRAYIGFWFVVN